MSVSELNKRFKVFWTTLLVGWRGIGQLRRLVSIPEIQQFAVENLEKENIASTVLPNLSELATISEKESDQVDILLEKMAAPERVNKEFEERKWVILLLEKQLADLPNDPLHGLLQLTEFWSDLDYPSYSPHQIQGVGNTMTPEKYYTSENYKTEIANHKKWLESQILNLSRSDSH
jgi:hypothetical protein